MERFNQSFADGKQEIDIDAKYLPKGRYRLGQNITVATSESSDKGVVQNIRGNRMIPFSFSNPVSTGATTIGHGVDTLNNKIYWFFIGNTTEGIYEFDPEVNMVNRILEVSRYRRILNFNVNNRITGVNIIGGDLYWTDNLNEPRQINIARFRGTTIDPVQDSSTPPVPLASLVVNTISIDPEAGPVAVNRTAFSSDLINLGKRPPLFPISLSNPHSTNPYGIPTSPLYEKFVYFSYYYIYRGGQESVLAPFTQAAFFPENFSVSRDSGVLDCMVNRFRSVDLRYDVGDEEVREIVLVFKESNNTLLYELTTINKDSNTNIVSSTPIERRFGTFTYDSEKVYRTLPSNKLTDIYDNVPLRAQAQDFVGNRLVFANTIENYPLRIGSPTGTELNVEFNVTYSTTQKNETDMAPSKSVKSGRFYEIGIQYLDRLNRQTPALVPNIAYEEGDTIRTNTVFVPFEESLNRNQLEIEIFNEAPYWATHWRTSIKSVKGPFYNIFPTNTIVPANGERAYLRIPSLESNQTTDERTGVTSTVNKVRTDDIITLKSYSKANASDAESTRRDYRVIDVGFIDGSTNMDIGDMNSGVYITVAPVVNGDLTAIPNGNTTTIFETVPQDQDLDIYVEYGETFRVDNGLHTGATEEVVRLDHPRQIRSESDSSVSSLRVRLCWFNCFSYSNGVESMHIRDEFFGNPLDAGVRATTVQENYRERNNLSRLIHSGIFNDDQNQNRLNQFSVSQNISHELDMFDGSIQKLHARNTNLIVFQEDKVKLVPINKNLVTTADGQESFSVSSAFFNTEQAYTGNYGISRNPDSFAEYGANIYWVDENRGCVCRLSPSGIDEISRYGTEVLFRTASKAAPLVLGGYDQFHKRYVPCFRNISIPNPNPGRADAVISQDGSLDPRTECQRNTDIARFQPVFIEMPDGGTEISVGDVVFTNAPPRDAMGNITGSSTNPFNGDFRWYRVRTMSGVSFLYDTIWQISPNGDIINLLGGPGSVSTCASIFSTQVVRNDFGISSERFIDEFDACANGIVDSNAYFGCPLNADGTEQTCTINSGDIPLVNQVVYENRTDLVPSNRTGWYLTVQGRLQFAINLEKGVVIDVVDCREISLGRRQIQGSQSLVVDANESDFLRNQRLCSVNNSSITYFWNGTKEVPQTGETVFISNFENTVAPANRYLVFSNGLFVQLNAMSQVDTNGVRSCFEPQCTKNTGDLFNSASVDTIILDRLNTEGGGTRGISILGYNDTTTNIANALETANVNSAYVAQAEAGEPFDLLATDANTMWSRQTTGDDTRLRWTFFFPAANAFGQNLNTGLDLLVFRDQNNWVHLRVVSSLTLRNPVVARGFSADVVDSRGTVGSTFDGYRPTMQTPLTDVFAELNYQTVFRGINVNQQLLPILGAEIDWIVQGEGRYPATGTFTQTASIINPGEVITLNVPQGTSITESGTEEILTEVCYRENPATRGVRSIFRTAAGTSPATICGLQAGTAVFYDETTQAYYSDLALTTRFNGGDSFYGISTTQNTTPSVVEQIGSSGAIIETSRVFCSTRNQLSLSFVSLTSNVSQACSSSTANYFADNVNFSSTGGSAATTLVLADGTGTVAPDGIYSNRVVARRLISGVLQPNEPETCNVNAVAIAANFGATALDACHVVNSDTMINIFTNNDAFNAQTTAVFGSSDLQTPRDTGYYQVNNMVGFWNQSTGVLSFEGTCPMLPTFTFQTAGVDCVVASNGNVTITENLGTTTSFTSSASDFTPNSDNTGGSFATVSSNTERTISVTVLVPTGYSNSGSTVTGDCVTTQPAQAADPLFTFNTANVSCTVTQAGVVDVTAERGTVSSFTPTNAGSFTGTGTREVTIDVVVTVPATGFSNSGGTVMGQCIGTQSATPQTFTFTNTGASASVSSAGAISHSASVGTTALAPDAAQTDPNYQDATNSFPALTGNASASRTIVLDVTGTIPNGFANAGGSFNVRGSVTTTQQGPGLSAYTPTISTAVDNNAGTITVTDTGAGTVTNVRNNTFTPFVGSSTMQTVTFDVTIPSGFLNAGGTLADRTVDVEIGPRDFVASDWTGSFSVAQNGDISFEQGNSAATITNLSANPSGANTGENARDVAVTGRITIPSGYMNTGSTIDITRTVSQAGMPVTRTLVVTPTTIELESSGFATSGGGRVTINSGPTAGRWGVSISDNWIVFDRNSNTQGTITADGFTGSGTRTGSVTITHLDNSSLFRRITVRQTGGQQV